MKNLDLRKLHHAIVLAEETTFVRASKRLHISQPALTRSIQNLESDLDLQLFDRNLSGVMPTPEGRVVLERGRELLHQMGSLYREIGQLKNIDSGELALGVGAGTQNPLLRQLMLALVTRHPRLTVVMEVEPVADLVDLLTRERIEFFVADKGQIRPAARKQLVLEKLLSCHGGYFARRDHPLAGLRDFPLEMIADFPLIGCKTEDNEWHPPGKFEKQYFKSGKLNGIVCNDIATVKSVVLASDAILVTIDAMVADELANGSLRELKFHNPGFSTEREICLATLRGKTLSNVARMAIDTLVAIAASAAPGR
jgi:DNA-binding transcriptional LysR family regulator